MDLMFEDEVDEVGSDVEAYCPKCKTDTTHVVISKYEDEIRRVQCNPCGDVHSFRKPRGEAEDDVPEPMAARKRALLKKPTFEEFFAKKKANNPAPYQFRQTYKEHDILMHPTFGLGFVSEILPDSKMEATFKDGRRFLVHGRKDLPGIPRGDGLPTQTAADKQASGEKKSGATAKAGKAGGSEQKAAAPSAKAAAAKPARRSTKTATAAAKPAANRAATSSAKPRSAASSAKSPAKGRPSAKAPAKPAKKAAAKKK